MENRLYGIVHPLLIWYEKNKRELPWRKEVNAYHTWISEIMLQQTRVEAVKGYYERFLERLPDIESLAETDDDTLLKLWQGLGYYTRARNLKKAAMVVMEEYGGSFPEEYEQIRKLPGIGDYTAGAIASIAFGKRVPAVDGNVYRIYTRLEADGDDITKAKMKNRVFAQIAEIVPEKQSRDFNQALMDLGAMICLPNGMPLCEICPLNAFCKSYQAGNMSDYPNKPKKKPRKIEEKTVFVLEYQGEYLLQQRSEKGLLAGLWEFPSQEGKMSLEELREAVRDWNVSGEQIELLGNAKHIFSHIEWHMLGYLIHLTAIPEELKESTVRASVKRIEREYSIPSAFSAYLEKILDGTKLKEE